MMTEKRHANVALFVPHEGCPHDCAFCDQRTIAGTQHGLTAADVTTACGRALATLAADTTAQIAFFGGSFTAIGRTYMCELLEAAQPFLATGRFDGIRVSTRPDAVDDEVLALLKSYGVTAVELGAQSMSDTVLTACGRGHTAADVRDAAARVHAHGMELGLQMMTGLPLDTDCEAECTAHRLAALKPATMRIYPTVVLEGTALAAWWREGRYTPPTVAETVRLCARLLYFFEQHCGIPVIRMGLHDGDTLRARVLAGGYHPALRELCENEMYYELASAAIVEAEQVSHERPITLLVSPKAVSKMIGQRKCNLERLANAGLTVRVKGDARVPLWEVWARPTEEQTERE